MVSYRYKAIDSTGRQVAGEMTAQTSKQVEQKLQSQKLIPVYVVTDRPPESAARPKADQSQLLKTLLQRKRRISQDEICEIMRSLAIMSNSGVALIDSLDTLSESAARPEICDLIGAVKQDVLGGKTLARAMQGQGDVFPEIASEMVAIADEGGQLGKALQTTTDYLELQAATRKAIIGALVYPGLLMAMSFCTILGFMFFILPTFGKTFSGMNIKLPPVTAIMLGVADFVTANANAVIIGLVVTVVAGVQILKQKPVKKFFRKAFYGVPVVGNIGKQLALARSASTLAALTGTNIPIIRAIEYAGRVAVEDKLTKGYAAVSNAVENGDTIAESMASHKCFPPMLVQLVTVGERSGRLSELVNVAALQMQSQAERKMKAALTIIEPVMIIVMGVVIGGLTLSILIPLFSLQQNINNK